LACVHLRRNNLISAGPVAGSPVVYAAHRSVPVLLGSGSNAKVVPGFVMRTGASMRAEGTHLIAATTTATAGRM